MGYGQYSPEYRGRRSMKEVFSHEITHSPGFFAVAEANNTWRWALFDDAGFTLEVYYRLHDTDILSLKLSAPISRDAFKGRGARKAWNLPAGVEVSKFCASHHESVTTRDRFRGLAHRHGIPLGITSAGFTLSVNVSAADLPPGVTRVPQAWDSLDLTKAEEASDGTLMAPFSRRCGGLQPVALTLVSSERCNTGWLDSAAFDGTLRSVVEALTGEITEWKAPITKRVAGLGRVRGDLMPVYDPGASDNPVHFTFTPRTKNVTVFNPRPRQPIITPPDAPASSRIQISAANAFLNWVNPFLDRDEHITEVVIGPCAVQSPTQNLRWISPLRAEQTLYDVGFMTSKGRTGYAPVRKMLVGASRLEPALDLWRMAGGETPPRPSTILNEEQMGLTAMRVEALVNAEGGDPAHVMKDAPTVLACMMKALSPVEIADMAFFAATHTHLEASPLYVTLDTAFRPQFINKRG